VGNGRVAGAARAIDLANVRIDYGTRYLHDPRISRLGGLAMMMLTEGLARKLKTSPAVAQMLMLALMGLFYFTIGPEEVDFVGVAIFVGISAIVVVVSAVIHKGWFDRISD
jgi:hypothetical protein